MTNQYTQKEIDEFFEVVKDYFNQFPLHYMMYAGGSGGEFISAKINEYSKRYQRVDCHTEPDLNRTILKNNLFLSTITFCRSRTDDPDDIYRLMVKEMIDRKETLEFSLRKTKEVADNRLFLYRVHLAKNPFFNKTNTWGLMLDNEDWWQYSNYMRHIKVYGRVASRELVLENLQLFFKFTETEQARFDELNSILDQRGEQTIKEGHAQIIVNDKLFAEVGDIKQVLSMSNLDMLPVYKLLYGTWERRGSFIRETLQDVNHINLSMLFEPGYVSSMFDIQDETNFLAEMKNWHKTNILLMEKSGFDASPYKYVLES
jgi:hypothetical protein